MASTYGYFATITVLGLVSASLGPTLLGFAENTQSEIRQISILFLARSLGFMLGSLIGGRALDLLPAHWVITTALVAISLTLFVAPILPILWILAAVMLLVGMSMGTLDMGSNTLLVWVHRSKVGPYMQALHLLWSLGAFLSPIIVVQIMGIGGGIRWSYWLLASLFLPVAAWIVRLPSPSSVQSGVGGEGVEVNYRLGRLYRPLSLRLCGRRGEFWRLVVHVRNDSWALPRSSSAGYLTSLFWGAVTLGRVVAIPAAARLRPSTILLTDLVGCLLSVAIILLWSDSVTALWAGTFRHGVLYGDDFPNRDPVGGTANGAERIGHALVLCRRQPGCDDLSVVGGSVFRLERTPGDDGHCVRPITAGSGPVLVC